MDPPGRSVRPMLPANSVSPAINFFSAGKYRQTLPSVCPGVWITFAVSEPASDRVPLSDALINLYFAGILHADPCRLHIQHFQQGMVILIEQDGCAGGGPQFHGSAHMIDVSMRNHDLLYREIVLANQHEDIFDVIAGINHQGFASGFVPDNRAVALQRPDGKDFVNHGRSRRSSVSIEQSRVGLGQRPNDQNDYCDYFCGAGAGAGVAGCVLVCDGFSPCVMELELPAPREAITDSVIDVIMKITVDHVVALESAVAAPRGPNAVWLPIRQTQPQYHRSCRSAAAPR